MSDDPDTEAGIEAFMADLRTAYSRGKKAKVPSNELSIVLLTAAYKVLQLTFDLDQEQFWRMVADSARRYVVSGAFEAAEREDGDSSGRIH